MKDQQSIDQTLNHLFRHESGKMVSVLVKIFGTENFELAEDVVQDALVKALETWKYKGMPDNPRAWLYRVARNKAIDTIRKHKHTNLIDFSTSEKQLLSSEYTLSTTMDTFWQEPNIQDDFLGMMFACCHPEISKENQITFILKSLCGFSTKEVARSFLTSEDTISKRLYRTKEYFRKNKISPVIPSEEEISGRTATVLSSIYLLFNEGYNATHSEEIIRKDLIEQALHLCKSLLDNKKTNSPEANALMALMCFHTSRSESRVNLNGDLILLQDQDRKSWNNELIEAGRDYLFKAGLGTTYSAYHFEAGIAYQHCIAKTYEDTNWNAILTNYDLLLAIADDPIVALNRCLVILESAGPEPALEAIENLENEPILLNYHLYHASLGKIHEKSGNKNKAVACYKKAMTLTQSKHEKQFFAQKISTI
ncbi:RNA polymerase sigma factor [Ulvibacter antarcticus]|uniref:RNA polymerase sigma factor n=1 Tax=Ulvibacter antarcticus TaxID=442714 RepID=A0A3L9YGN7_9FLAO|nr:sigma-70 family RNA polymerase sigma factor [Ulvibacter antarcticus]RMA57048.1 RNA polymerase sigma-70 factor (ECF subfamily) [Ulvibacter antarcticus]